MSLLSIIQDAAAEVGIKTPSIVISNADTQVKRLLRFVNAEGVLQSTGVHLWRKLVKGITFSALAQEDQGDIETIAPGFRQMIPQSMWNRSTDYLLHGSLTPQEWQQRQAMPYVGLRYDFRIIENNLHITPAPGLNETIAFEYITKNWVENAAGSTSYPRFNADTDVPLLDEELLTLAAAWRWRKHMGLDYSADYALYEQRLDLLIYADTPRKPLRMATEFTLDHDQAHLPMWSGVINL